MILHSPPEFNWSCFEQYGACDGYDVCGLGIQNCDEQNPQVMSTEPSIWYVVAAWNESKQWCGVEFGVGAYVENAIYVVTDEPCPNSALFIPSENWPHPNSGVSVASASEPWDGNFRPVYYFIGYAYSPGQIPLTGLVRPAESVRGAARARLLHQSGLLPHLRGRVRGDARRLASGVGLVRRHALRA